MSVALVAMKYSNGLIFLENVTVNVVASIATNVMPAIAAARLPLFLLACIVEPSSSELRELGVFKVSPELPCEFGAALSSEVS